MSYEVSADLENEFIHLHYSGVLNLDERIKARKEVFDLCQEHGIHRSLVETQDSSILMNLDDIVRFGTTFKDIDLPQKYRVAMVIASSDDANTLLEVVASIDGLNIKVFLDREEALHWLLAF